MALVALLAYLAMLAAHGWQEEPDLLVIYQSGPDRPPPVHPDTDRLAWASPTAIAAELQRTRERRQARPTEWLNANPSATSSRWVQHDGATVALVELASGGLPGLLDELEGQPADLVVVATCQPVPAILAAIPQPLAVLPGCFGPGVPGEVELRASDRLVAPWVDSRWRLGELRITLGEHIELAGLSTSLRGEPAAEGASTTAGIAGPGLGHDLIRFGQVGLGGALGTEIRRRTGADVVVFNYLSMREGLEGLVTMSQLETALPFHNQIALLTMPGRGLLDELALNRHLDTRYLVVAGATEGPDGAWLLADGRPLSPDLSLRVATIDYLADGGRGKRPAFARGTDRLDTGLYTDRIALDLLAPPP